MRQDNEADSIREAMQYLMASDIPSEHKRVLLAVATQALGMAQAAADHLRLAPTAHDLADWEPRETQLVREFLDGKIAMSWQDADEMLMRLAGELHRNPDQVRAKAVELGVGMGVDYPLAKAHQQRSQ